MNSNTLRPLQAGDVVSAGLRLYRSNLTRYLPVALVAALWPLVGMLGLGAAIGVGALLGAVSSPALGILVGLVLGLGALGLLMFSAAKSGLNAAVIARLAFRELINQPESVSEARHALRPRLWQFFWVQGLLIGCLFGTQIGTSLVQNLVGFPLIAIFGDSLLAPLLVLVLTLGSTGVYYWVLARLFVPDMAIAVETTDLSPSQAIERSWSLTQGSAVRISLVLLLASLVTIPFFLIAAIPLVLAMIAALTQTGDLFLAQPDSALLSSLGIGVLLSIVLFLGANLLFIAFWQSIKAVVYYDLCSRQEGLDLKLSRGARSDDGAGATGVEGSGASRSGAGASRSGASRSGTGSGKPRSSKPKSPVDEQWAAAIAAMNAGKGYKAADPDAPAARGSNPARFDDEDEDELPTQIATHLPTFPADRPAAPRTAAGSPAFNPPPFNPPPLPSPSANTPRISPQAEPVATTLSSHGGLYHMGSRDFEAVTEYLLIRSTLPPDQRKQQSLALARRLKETIQLPKLPGKLTPELFLEALYLAYRDRT